MKPPRSLEFPEPDKHPDFPWESRLEAFKGEEAKKTEDKSNKHQKKERQTKQEDLAREKTHLKKEKIENQRRKEQLERSLAYKKQFEEAPPPKDPALVARLLIADRIIALNETLEDDRQDHKKETDTVALATTLDYLGDLSDKFENPEMESSPEIQQAYETILQLTSEALDNAATPKELLSANELDTTEHLTPREGPIALHRNESELQPAPVDGDTLTTQPASPLTTPPATMLLRALNGPAESRFASAPPSSHRPLFQASSSQQATPPTPLRQPPSLSSLPLRAPTLAVSAEHARTGSRKMLHSERIAYSPATPDAVPAAIAAVALLSREDTLTKASSPPETIPQDVPSSARPVTHEATTSSSNPPTQTRQYNAAPRAHHHQADHGVSRTYTPAETPFSMIKTEPHTLEQASAPAKFEFMPLHSLLTKAEHVPVGHGNYLRRAYEQGQIDKEGLISVLKANAKGRDFRLEFQKQARRTQQLRASSPEFLRKSPQSASQPADEADDASIPHTPSEVPDLDTASPIPHSSLETAQQTLASIKTVRENTWPDSSRPASRVWVFAIVLFAGIIVIILVFIFI